MRAVIQRVRRGRVSVEGREVAAIGQGLVILLGVGPQDTEQNGRALARKAAMLRIFSDEQGKMNRSVLDVKGQVIVVSQFTLYADTRRGHRPSFTDAAPPDMARPLADRFVEFMQELGVLTQAGEFGAHMLVEIENDGPVTIVLDM
jgi:D-tyrosyl-tRNA(Tyr) deacylase